MRVSVYVCSVCDCVCVVCMCIKDVKFVLIELQVFKALLLPIVMMLFIRESELCPLIGESFMFFDWHLQCLRLFRLCYKWDDIAFVFYYRAHNFNHIEANYMVCFFCMLNNIPWGGFTTFLFIHSSKSGHLTSVSRLLWSETFSSSRYRPMGGIAISTATHCFLSLSMELRVCTFPTPYHHSISCLVYNSYPVGVVWCFIVVYLALALP